MCHLVFVEQGKGAITMKWTQYVAYYTQFSRWLTPWYFCGIDRRMERMSLEETPEAPYSRDP